MDKVGIVVLVTLLLAPLFTWLAESGHEKAVESANRIIWAVAIFFVIFAICVQAGCLD